MKTMGRLAGALLVVAGLLTTVGIPRARADDSTTAAASTPLIRQGTAGGAVRTIQYLQRAHGADVDVDGDFGPVTATALRAFQQQAGLSVDGIVGPRTWTALVSGR